MITIEQKIRHLEGLLYEDEQAKWLASIKDAPIADIKVALAVLKSQKTSLDTSIENLKIQANE